MVLKYQPLTPDEINKAFPKRGQMDLTDFEDMLRPLSPGNGIAIELNGLTKRQLKRRVTSAARRVWADCKLRYTDDPAGARLLVLVKEAKSAS